MNSAPLRTEVVSLHDGCDTPVDHNESQAPLALSEQFGMPRPIETALTQIGASMTGRTGDASPSCDLKRLEYKKLSGHQIFQAMSRISSDCSSSAPALTLWRKSHQNFSDMSYPERSAKEYQRELRVWRT